MAGVKPYSVERIAPVYIYPMVEHVDRVCVTARPLVYHYQRSGLVDGQSLLIVGHVAG